METLPLHTFKKSFEPILDLLKEYELKYNIRKMKPGVVMASSTTIELILSAGMFGALATVLVAFIKAHHGRKVIITTKEDSTIHIEGITSKELSTILQETKSITAIDPT